MQPTEDDGIRTAQITITRTFYPDRDGDEADTIQAVTSDGMSLFEMIGMIEFARVSLVESALRGDPEDEE